MKIYWNVDLEDSDKLEFREDIKHGNDKQRNK